MLGGALPEILAAELDLADSQADPMDGSWCLEGEMPQAASTLRPIASAIDLNEILAEEYRLLRPRAPIPPIRARFYRFTSLNTTIRLREGELRVHLSDLLESAPEAVLRAIAHILLAKLYRKPIDTAHTARYRRFTLSEPVLKRTEQIRQLRGRKRIVSAKGQHYDLEEIFDALNERFFYGLLGRPVLTWSEHSARRLLGHYDAAHNTIMVSRVFDQTQTPRYAIEYLMYHEMLHLKHPVTVRRGRRCVHPAAFQQEERLFPLLEEAKVFLKTLS
jgi:hypothetical protein